MGLGLGHAIWALDTVGLGRDVLTHENTHKYPKIYPKNLPNNNTQCTDLPLRNPSTNSLLGSSWS